MSIATSTLLEQHPAVIDLISILDQNNQPDMAQELRGLAMHVSGIEHVLRMTNMELNTMRRDLATLREQHGEQLHNLAQQGIQSAHREVSQVSDRVGAVKDWIVQGSKDAAAAFRDKGITAMSKAVSFLGIRKELEHIQKDMKANVAIRDMSIAKIEKISKQYHETGTAVRNFGRAVAGKEAQEDTRPMGKLAKLAAAPHKAMKSLCISVAGHAEAALTKLERLEEAAAARRPSMLQDLQSMKETKGQPKALPPAEKKPQEESR